MQVPRGISRLPAISPRHVSSSDLLLFYSCSSLDVWDQQRLDFVPPCVKLSAWMISCRICSWMCSHSLIIMKDGRWLWRYLHDFISGAFTRGQSKTTTIWFKPPWSKCWICSRKGLQYSRSPIYSGVSRNWVWIQFIYSALVNASFYLNCGSCMARCLTAILL